MALSSKVLQRKRVGKKNKRKARLPSKSVAAGYSWPLYEAWITKKSQFWDNGVGYVIVSRKNDNDIAIGAYLVDIYCLGVKDCYYRSTNISGYRNFLDMMADAAGSLELVDFVYANTLIHKAVEYAQLLGFKPYKDFTKLQKMLIDIPISEKLKFNFGQDGKPLYIQGPYETAARAKKILQTLDMNVGVGNYHFIVIDEDFLSGPRSD